MRLASSSSGSGSDSSGPVPRRVPSWSEAAATAAAAQRKEWCQAQQPATQLAEGTCSPRRSSAGTLPRIVSGEDLGGWVPWVAEEDWLQLASFDGIPWVAEEH